jgi:hypothetical protein
LHLSWIDVVFRELGLRRRKGEDAGKVRLIGGALLGSSSQLLLQIRERDNMVVARDCGMRADEQHRSWR